MKLKKGDRFLANTSGHWPGSIWEAEVLEINPSQTLVKLKMRLSNSIVWYERKDFIVIEILPPEV